MLAIERRKRIGTPGIHGTAMRMHVYKPGKHQEPRAVYVEPSPVRKRRSGIGHETIAYPDISDHIKRGRGIDDAPSPQYDIIARHII